MARARTLQYENQGVRYVFGVFDSHLLEVPVDMSDEDIVKIMDDMSDFSNLYSGFKFRYDWASGMSWGEAYEKL